MVFCPTANTLNADKANICQFPLPTNYLMFAKETKENKETATLIKILPRLSELVFRKLGNRVQNSFLYIV